MQRKDIVKQTDLIISEIELPPDSEPIWRWHTQIQETVYCLEGQLLVLGMRQPVEQTLGLGEKFDFAPQQKHALGNVSGKPVRYLLIQQGVYDFNTCQAPVSSKVN